MRALRQRNAVALTALAPVLLLSACSSDFDTTRNPAPRGTLGAELFGVFCDRVGAQALHEDLTGASYSAVCHASADGSYATQVDAAQLPALVDGALDSDGKPVPLAKQQTDRAYGVARIEALGRARVNLVPALDATFPASMIAIKDNTNPDPTKSCGVPATGGEGSLHDELAALLGRLHGPVQRRHHPPVDGVARARHERLQGVARRAGRLRAIRRAAGLSPHRGHPGRRAPAHRLPAASRPLERFPDHPRGRLEAVRPEPEARRAGQPDPRARRRVPAVLGAPPGRARRAAERRHRPAACLAARAADGRPGGPRRVAEAAQQPRDPRVDPLPPGPGVRLRHLAVHRPA